MQLYNWLYNSMHDSYHDGTPGMIIELHNSNYDWRRSTNYICVRSSIMALCNWFMAHRYNWISTIRLMGLHTILETHHSHNGAYWYMIQLDDWIVWVPWLSMELHDHAFLCPLKPYMITQRLESHNPTKFWMKFISDNKKLLYSSYLNRHCAWGSWLCSVMKTFCFTGRFWGKKRPVLVSFTSAEKAVEQGLSVMLCTCEATVEFEWQQIVVT